MTNLSTKTCIPCRGGVEPLNNEAVQNYLRELVGWQVIDHHHLQKSFSFPDFKAALALVNRIGEVAEQENHHPNISFTWGQVDIEIWTHVIDGLHENDFVLAAKIDALT